MYVSAPLCRLLTPDEFKSVLAHELAHYKGRDTRFSQRFYPIYRGATEGLAGIAQGLSRGDKGSASDFVLLPAFFMLSYFLGCFSKAENEISRDRELAADAEAARIGDARTIATALVKVDAYADAWPFVREQMKKALTQGQQLINPSLLFATMVADVAKEHDPLATLGEEGPPHPTDTHPPLSQRLKALNVPMKDIRAAALALPENPSLTLIDNPEALEKDLSDIEHAIMLHRGEAQLPSPPEEETPPATQP